MYNFLTLCLTNYFTSPILKLVVIINYLITKTMATKKLIEEVWDKAKEMRGKDPNVWRKDKYDNKIRFGSYGT